MEVQAQHRAEVMFVTMQGVLPKPKVRRKGNHLILQHRKCQRQLMALAHMMRHELNEPKSRPRARRRKVSPRKAKTHARIVSKTRKDGGIVRGGNPGEVSSAECLRYLRAAE